MARRARRAAARVAARAMVVGKQLTAEKATVMVVATATAMAAGRAVVMVVVTAGVKVMAAVARVAVIVMVLKARAVARAREEAGKVVEKAIVAKRAKAEEVMVARTVADVVAIAAHWTEEGRETARATAAAASRA